MTTSETDTIDAFDHCGFIIENPPRAQSFYKEVFGSELVHYGNFNTATYSESGGPIISFVSVGAHVFELCMAKKPLAANERPVPRIGLIIDLPSIEAMTSALDRLELSYEIIELSDLWSSHKQCVRIQDADDNYLDLVIGKALTEDGHSNGTVPAVDISHVVMEAIDLDRTVEFYTSIFGLHEVGRDNGDLGQGRSILANSRGQLLALEKVSQLSPRAKFRGRDLTKTPDANADGYHGAHLAMTVASPDIYDRLCKAWTDWGVISEGDFLATERAPGTKTEYFYDPSGNRLQVIALNTYPASSS